MLNMIIAGFGGQGILFTGKIIAHAGLMLDKNVSWLPSYGPEMRGGTANCSVCIDDEQISSPFVTEPNLLIVMNAPSYQKFYDKVENGGFLIYDSSLIENPPLKEGVHTFGIPATAMANKESLNGLANLIVLGFVLKKTQFMNMDDIIKALEKNIPKSKMHLLQPNIKALNLGFDFVS